MGNVTKTELIMKANLRKLREGKKLTPYAFAKQAGIDPAMYYRLEDNDYHNRCTFEFLEKLAAYCNIEVWELLKEI